MKTLQRQNPHDSQSSETAHQVVSSNAADRDRGMFSIPDTQKRSLQLHGKAANEASAGRGSRVVSRIRARPRLFNPDYREQALSPAHERAPAATVQRTPATDPPMLLRR